MAAACSDHPKRRRDIEPSSNRRPLRGDNRTGLGSEKPIDLFKVKARDKGKPEAEGPLSAYRILVVIQGRHGLYSMPCAAPASLVPV